MRRLQGFAPQAAFSGYKEKTVAKRVEKRERRSAVLEPDAAGIDIGAHEIYVAVPLDCDEKTTRRFSSFTYDSHALADWLENCRVRTVAMESTGVYWIPLFQILEERGFMVYLVNAHSLKIAHLLKLLADPDGVDSRLHRVPHWRQIGKPSFDPGRCGEKPASVDHLAFFVERAVMTPDIAKIDPNRHLNPGAAPWYFRDEILRRFFIRIVSLFSVRPSHLTYR